MKYSRYHLNQIIRRVKSWLPLKFPDNFIFVVGAQKAGTTSLHYYLSQHPLVIEGEAKELAFFHKDCNYSRGLSYYRSFFPFKLNEKVAIDSTPENLYFSLAAQRIHNAVPSAKIVIVLREPVSRAFSAFNMYKQSVGNKPFEQYLITSNEVSRGFYEPIARGEIDPSIEYFLESELKIINQSGDAAEPALIRRGIYMPQISRYMELFGESNVLIIFSDELKSNQKNVVNRVFEFVGLEGLDSFNTESRHVRNYDVDESDKDKIREAAQHLFNQDKMDLQERFNLQVPW